MNDLILSMLRSAHHQANHDPLTGLGNRRAAFSHLASLASPTPRRQKVTLMMVDVDHFKSVNDTHGHPAGDRVLVTIANRIRSAVCKHEALYAETGTSVYRVGGEEFLVVTQTARESALAEWILEEVRTDPITFVEETRRGTLHATVSIGLATCDKGVFLESEGMERADRALYYAKLNGRNQVQAFARKGDLRRRSLRPRVRGQARDALTTVSFSICAFGSNGPEDTYTVRSRTPHSAAAAFASLHGDGLYVVSQLAGPVVVGAFLFEGDEVLDLSEWSRELPIPAPLGV